MSGAEEVTSNWNNSDSPDEAESNLPPSEQQVERKKKRLQVGEVEGAEVPGEKTLSGRRRAGSQKQKIFSPLWEREHEREVEREDERGEE